MECDEYKAESVVVMKGRDSAKSGLMRVKCESLCTYESLLPLSRVVGQRPRRHLSAGDAAGSVAVADGMNQAPAHQLSARTNQSHSRS